MMEDEDYEFDYEDSDQDQDDGQVDMENEYYTAKGERCTSAFLRRKR
jgi:COP9 signalosome complex subunit 2